MEKTLHYSVMISDRAQQMLGVHIRFLAKISPLAARKTKSELMKAIHSLETIPQRFSFFNGEYIPANKYHKIFIENWYLVLYQIKDQTVYVDYIVDTRQDHSYLLK